MVISIDLSIASNQSVLAGIDIRPSFAGDNVSLGIELKCQVSLWTSLDTSFNVAIAVDADTGKATASLMVDTGLSPMCANIELTASSWFVSVGILKKIYKKIKFSKKSTENNLSKKSFVETFLQSVKKKMYGVK